MSSSDVPPLLTLLVPALVALAALIAGVLLTLRAKARAQHSEQRLRDVLASVPLASAVIEENGRILQLDSGFDPDTLWFRPADAVGAVLWELPATDAEFAASLRALTEATFRDGSDDLTWDYEDADGNSRRIGVISLVSQDAKTNPKRAHVAIIDRTIQRLQEDSVAQARTYYRGLFLNSPDAIACIEHDRPGVSTRWPIDRQIDAFFEGRVADCNEAYARRLGRNDRQEVVGRKIKEILPRNEAGVDLLTRVIENGYKLQGWYSPRARNDDESREPINHITHIADFEDSRVVRTWNVFRDITDSLGEIDAVALGAERQKSLLRAEEAYLCIEFDPAIDIHLPLEEQARRMLSGRLVECNEAFAKTAGAEDPDSIVGMKMIELLPRSVVANADEKIRQAMVQYIESGYKLEDYRYDVTLPNGSRFVTTVNCRGVVKNGELTRHWGMIRDITEREEQLRDLKRSEARYERMAQQSPALIYRLRVAQDVAFEYVNEAIQAISGYPRDHEQINNLVVHEVFAATNLEELLGHIETGADMPVLTQHMHRDGNIVYLEHRVVPIFDKSNQLQFIEGAALDVTERRHSQQQLHTALSEISKLSEALKHENVQLREEIRNSRSFDLIIGNSPKFTKVVDLATRAAPTSSTVLILGETGTGKELFARSIHESSPRSEKPLISVNCAALPTSLIESELFGHTKGAFTGADAARTGRFEAADGGTLFLDEIAELSLELQGKLLRVVQEGEFQRLGDNKTIKVDVRLLAATNSDLAAAVERGEFRADLYYRLNVFPILIPPLRDRVEDIPVLANHFAIKHCHRLGKTFEAISPDLLRILMNHHWPGNVRELESVIERSIIVSSSGTLQPVELRSQRVRREPRDVNELAQSAEVLQRSLQDAERHHILRTLERVDWVIEGAEGAASILGIAPSTLRSKMKKLGIARPAASDLGSADLAKRQLH